MVEQLSMLVFALDFVNPILFSFSLATHILVTQHSQSTGSDQIPYFNSVREIVLTVMSELVLLLMLMNDASIF